MSKAKKLLFTFALAAVIMVTAAATLGSPRRVEAAPDLAYQTYETYSDDTLFIRRPFSRSLGAVRPPLIGR